MRRQHAMAFTAIKPVCLIAALAVLIAAAHLSDGGEASALGSAEARYRLASAATECSPNESPLPTEARYIASVRWAGCAEPSVCGVSGPPARGKSGALCIASATRSPILVR